MKSMIAALRLWLLLPLLLVSCRSYFPSDVKAQVSEEGAAGLDYGRKAGISYLVTTQYIPGAMRSSRARQQHAHCNADGRHVEVRWRNPDIAPEQAMRTCGWVLSAAAFVAGYSGGSRVRNLRVTVIDEGEGRDTRWLSIAPPGGLSMRLAVRWLGDEAHSAAEAVRLFAHELTHVDAHFASPLHVGDTEQLAYLAGACAQWHVIGTLATRDLEAGVLNVDEAVFRHSSDVANRVWSLLHPFIAEGPLTRGHPQAAAFSTLCDARLKSGFESLQVGAMHPGGGSSIHRRGAWITRE